MDTQVADPLLGALLDGRYRVAGRVARGGMATVYHATDERLERTVAVKIIQPAQASDRRFAAKFADEAKAIARLAHPNVVAVYDSGQHDGLPYLVMEYVRGTTLRDLLAARGRLPAAEALDLLEQIVAALSAAHRAGLVHRDVKPENVLIATDGTVKVADFGLARAVEASNDDGGQLLATVAYVPPELVSAGHTDPRGDVYSAGVVLFEMLTGRVPYDGTRAVDVAWAHVEHDVPPPSRYAPGVPPAVDDLVARATRRDPGARPTDAGALLAEVRQAREDLNGASAAYTMAIPRVEPRVAGRVTAPGPRPRTSKTRWLDRLDPRGRPSRGMRPALLATLVVLGILVTCGGWWLAAGRFTQAPTLTDITQSAATTKAINAGFTVRVAEQFSDKVAKGKVINQNPGAGERIARGGVINLVVSKGPDKHFVPDVIGRSFDTAVAELRKAGLTAQRVDRFDDNMPAGNVVEVNPTVGAEVQPGTGVALVVSKGPSPFKMPNVVGKQVDDAKRDLAKFNLQVEVTEVDNSQKPGGEVLEQDPSDGTGIDKGQKVTLKVSKGPPFVLVPDLSGQTFEEASKSLEDLGLKVVKGFEIGKRSRVRVQNPPAGTQVQAGTTVTIWLY